MPSQVISHVRIDDADWATTPDIPLNPGFVAIIGARGSGKTALVDVIAAGCDAITPAGWDADENISPSFLARARRLIGDATTTLTWGGGAAVTRLLDGSDANGHVSFPRARYLSQQFVEELCSAKGVSDGLVDEIERVIFESHSQDDREWATDFAELREQQTSRFQQAREREAGAISDISDRIATEFEKESLVASLAAQVGQKRKLIADYTADRAKLVHGDLGKAVQQLKRESGTGLFAEGVKLPLALAELGLIDEYEFVIQPRLAGHGPTLFAGLSKRLNLKLVKPTGVRLGGGADAV